MLQRRLLVLDSLDKIACALVIAVDTESHKLDLG